MSFFPYYYGTLLKEDRSIAETILAGVDGQSMYLSSKKLSHLLTLLEQSNWNLSSYSFWIKRIRSLKQELPNHLQLDIVRFLSKIDQGVAQRIEDLKQEIEANSDNIPLETNRNLLLLYRNICQTYLSYCSISPSLGPPEHYFLREALGYSKLQEQLGYFEKEDLIIRWELLIKTGMDNQASELFITGAYDHLFTQAERVFFEAKAQFTRGHFYDVPMLLEEYPKNTPLDLPQRITRFWLGDRTPETQDQGFLGDWDEP